MTSHFDAVKKQAGEDDDYDDSDNDDVDNSFDSDHEIQPDVSCKPESSLENAPPSTRKKL